VNVYLYKEERAALRHCWKCHFSHEKKLNYKDFCLSKADRKADFCSCELKREQEQLNIILRDSHKHKKRYLLHILRPFRWVTKSHEYTVGQNSAHNDHAKYCRAKSRIKGTPAWLLTSPYGSLRITVLQ